MRFINSKPRRARPVPEWTKNLANEESKHWMINNYEIFHVEEMIEVSEFNKLQLIYKFLSTSDNEFSMEDCGEIFDRIETQIKDLHDHLNIIRLKNQKIQDDLGDDWLKEKNS
jgi:hypothetical protein